MRVVQLEQPSKMPSDFAEKLRDMAEMVERGEITEFVCAMVSGGHYEFVYPSSLLDSLTLSTLLHAECVDRMRR